MSLIKRVVYTAIFGGYDSLHEPEGFNKGIDFICFTDDPELRSQKWKVVLVSDNEPNAAMQNRKYKFSPHIYLKDYDESLYIDGNIFACSDSINDLFDKYLTEYKIAIPPHPERKCIYKEARKCIDVSKGDPLKIDLQMHYYQSVGFPSEYGLFENNVILRRHNEPEIIELMQSWLQQLLRFSARDQLSLCFLMWQHNIKCGYLLEGPRYSNRYLKIGYHKKEACLPLFKKIVLYIFLNKNRNKLFFNLSKIIGYFK